VSLSSLLVLSLITLPGATADPPIVEAVDLAKRADLIGKELIVDGRVSYFQVHDGIFDEIALKKVATVFRLPAELRSRQSPDAAAVQVRGVLKKDPNGLIFDVSKMTLLPGDQERIRQGVVGLTSSDAEGRHAWAAWARRRGTEYQEPALIERAHSLDAEAILIEAARPGANRPDVSLKLARKARDLGVPEPDPSALAHRSFRFRLNETHSAPDLERLANDISSFLPASRSPAPIPTDLTDWDAPYTNDPAGAYRKASDAVRAALDRRLLADALQRGFELRALEHPEDGLSLADRAREQLADRPGVAASIEASGLERMTDDEHVKVMRSDEMENWVRRFEARNEPVRAKDLKRRWLGQQRLRLRPTDAEARVALAAQYDAMTGDRSTSIGLLREAWKIDPESKEIANTFRRFGFRKVGDDWEEGGSSRTPTKRPDADSERTSTIDASADALQNLTRTEVKTKLGEPTRIVRSASRGQLLEQWIYSGGGKRIQYINFLFKPGMSQPLVHRSYSLTNP
jgi:hypothetical protein